MNKKEFIDTIKNIKSIIDDIEGVNVALKKLDPDFGGFYLSRIQTSLLGMLKKLMDDKEDWIRYFMYEMDGKFSNKKIITDKNDKKIPLKNYNDLWNLIKHY